MEGFSQHVTVLRGAVAQNRLRSSSEVIGDGFVQSALLLSSEGSGAGSDERLCLV